MSGASAKQKGSIVRGTETKQSADARARRPVAGPRFIASLLAVTLFASAAQAETLARTEMVDTALVLAVDVSGSINAERYALQMEGIARAFEDQGVDDILLAGAHRSMFVALVEWSNKTHMVVPWTLIASRQDARAFADKVRHAPRADNQFTCLSAALQVIEGKVLPFLPAPAEHIIVDVSGDGHDNCNPAVSVDAARDRLVAANVTINGLPILEGEEAETLEQWYVDHVVGGKSAFVVPAHGFADVQRAMRRKFIAEISAK
jgi:Protein of unknown function (DUF1194)